MPVSRMKGKISRLWWYKCTVYNKLETTLKVSDLRIAIYITGWQERHHKICFAKKEHFHLMCNQFIRRTFMIQPYILQYNRNLFQSFRFAHNHYNIYIYRVRNQLYPIFLADSGCKPPFYLSHKVHLMRLCLSSEYMNGYFILDQRIINLIIAPGQKFNVRYEPFVILHLAILCL